MTKAFVKYHPGEQVLPADPVYVGLYICREVEVDHIGNELEVYTT